jgi:tetratricopeptide (TPR) repeat protein
VLLTVAALLTFLTHGQTLVRGAGEGNVESLVKRAQELVKAREFDQAADLMKKVLQLQPKNDVLLAGASEMEHKAGRFADGYEHAVQALKLNDKAVPYYFLAALNAYGNQDLENARVHIKKLLAMSESEVGQAVLFNARNLDHLTSPKSYIIYWDLDPRKGLATKGSLIIALPKGDLPNQSVTYEVTGARSHRIVKTEANHVLYVVPQGLKPFRVTTKVTLQPYSYKKELAKASKDPLPAAAKSYLGPCECINPKSPALTKVVAELKTDDRVQTVRNILKWMRKNVEYKNESKDAGTLDFKVVDEIVKRGHAECRGYSMLFTALCRAAGIPARPVWGLNRIPPSPMQPKGGWASHNWAEVYFPGSGWIPLDPQAPESLGWLPATILRIYMDVRRNAASMENLPSRNLVHMNGGTLNFDIAP